jgi:hypothetical protein
MLSIKLKISSKMYFFIIFKCIHPWFILLTPTHSSLLCLLKECLVWEACLEECKCLLVWRVWILLQCKIDFFRIHISYFIRMIQINNISRSWVVFSRAAAMGGGGGGMPNFAGMGGAGAAPAPKSSGPQIDELD